MWLPKMKSHSPRTSIGSDLSAPARAQGGPPAARRLGDQGDLSFASRYPARRMIGVARPVVKLPEPAPWLTSWGGVLRIISLVRLGGSRNLGNGPRRGRSGGSS